MARHRSPQGHRASRFASSLRPLLATGNGGAHRSADSTRRNLLAAGGAAAVAGQVAFSHLISGSAPVLPSPAALMGAEPVESTITELAAVPLTPAHDGLGAVTMADPDALHQADAAQLAKTAGLNQAAAVAEAARADRPEVRGAQCPPDQVGLSGVKPWVDSAGVELRCIFKIGTVGGVGGRPNVSDHPRGLAVDFMTGGPNVNGDELADYTLKYKDDLRVKYVIWKQRINYGDGGGWHPMENRGSVTANHFDHVHVSFLG